MPVLRTPTKSRPSNRGSRDSTARYAASGSIPAGAVVVVVMPPLCDGGRAPVWRGSDMAVDRPPPGRLEVGVALLWYATEQSAHLGCVVAAVATEGLDRRDLAGLGPAGDGLGVDAEQRGDLRRRQQSLGLARSGVHVVLPSMSAARAGGMRQCHVLHYRDRPTKMPHSGQNGVSRPIYPGSYQFSTDGACSVQIVDGFRGQRLRRRRIRVIRGGGGPPV